MVKKMATFYVDKGDKKLSVKLDSEGTTIQLLKAICKEESRTQGEQVEYLIKKEAKRLGIKIEPEKVK